MEYSFRLTSGFDADGWIEGLKVSDESLLVAGRHDCRTAFPHPYLQPVEGGCRSRQASARRTDGDHLLHVAFPCREAATLNRQHPVRNPVTKAKHHQRYKRNCHHPDYSPYPLKIKDSHRHENYGKNPINHGHQPSVNLRLIYFSFLLHIPVNKGVAFQSNNLVTDKERIDDNSSISLPYRIFCLASQS